MPQNMPIYTTVPDIPTGYPIDGKWEVVVPIARTNEITNPSFETNTTGYTAGAGALARSTAKQYHGVYSAQYTPSSALTDGFFFGTITMTLNQYRAISCKFWGQPNVPYALTVATTGGVDRTIKSFRGTGRWQWIYLYHQETTASASRRIYFRKDGSSDVHPFYVDGVQSELINTGEYVSTYIDGDQRGLLANQFPTPFGWNGTPHGSTSYRTALTRAGGHVIPFSRYGFLLVAILGLGVPSPKNISTEYAQQDGGYPNYSRKPISQFSLVGNISAPSYLKLRSNRSSLSQLFDRDVNSLDQTLILRYALENQCGDVFSDTVAIECKYVNGWEGADNNRAGQSISMTFETYLPNISADGQHGSTLNVQTSIGSNANGVLQRSAAGVWSSVGSFTAGFGVYSIVRGTDGLVYMGGDFTPAPASAVTSYNGSSLSALGTGAAGGFVYQLASLPDGSIIAVGTYTSMGGVANTNKVAKWSPSGAAWSSISSGFVGTEIRTAVTGADGSLYIGGVFSSVGGTLMGNVGKWNGSSWSALGAGLSGGVNALLSVGSKLYAACDDNTIRVWNGSAWSSIGTLTGGSAFALAADSRGFIYVGGTFSAVAGITASNIAYYNGVSWFPLGTGLNNSVNTRAMSFDGKGLLYVGGDFTQAGGISTPTGSAIWNGSAWVYPDIIPAATAHMYGALALSDGRFFQGTINGGTAIGPGTTTVTNTGTARTYPTVIIKGPSSGTARIYSIVNATTGRSVYLNLTINAGETITMNFQPDELSFQSDFQGDVLPSILGGSNEADFFLGLGANSIAFLSGSSSVTAFMSWNEQYLNLDDIP